MDNFDTSSQASKKGQRQDTINKQSAQRHKQTNYAAQKKYRENNPDVYDFYEPKVRIPSEYRDTIKALSKKTGMSITELFIGAVEAKYNITLSRKS